MLSGGGRGGGGGRSAGEASSAPSSPAAAPPRTLASGALGEFLHGFGASAVSILLTFPLAKLASR